MSENTMLVPQMGINMEQATANCEELAKAIHEITAGVLTTVNSFCRWSSGWRRRWQHSRKWKRRCAGRRLTTARFITATATPKRSGSARSTPSGSWSGTERRWPRVEAESQQNQPLQSGGDIQAPAGYAPRGFPESECRPDYWLEWTTDDGHTKAFLSSSLGHPILTITTHDAAGGQLYHEAHRLSVEGLRERGMVEEVNTAMERRWQAHGRA